MNHSVGYWFVKLLLIITIITLLATFFHFVTKNFNYWKDRNVPYIATLFPYRNKLDIFLPPDFIGLIYKHLYLKLKGHKYGGFVFMGIPSLILRDPELIKQIMTKDFDYFIHRGIKVNENINPMSGHLLNLNGDKWRKLRTKLTPIFTPGKMKTMFHLMKASSKQLETSLIDHAEREDVIELNQFTAKFTISIIGPCAFGFNINSLNDPDNEFYKRSKGMYRISIRAIFRRKLNSILPGITKILGLKSTQKDRQQYFSRIVRESVDYRERSKVTRNDFLNLLIRLKKNEPIDDDDDDDEKNTNHDGNEIFNSLCKKDDDSGQLLDQNSTNDLIVTSDLVAAQCYGFFFAGFETSLTTLNFCLYELALNKEIQTKLQEEIDTILAKHNGEISYQSIYEMKYMDRVVQETLRKYPPVSLLERECTTDYKFKDSNVVIEKGIQLAIPLLGIHYDPEYYPDPERFNPDNFTEEAKQSRHPYTWLPFGEGPRQCIGIRFGILQVKTGLATLLSNYNFDRIPKTQVPMEFYAKTLLTTPKKEIKLKITKRQK
ncbi:putative cytochrome P450 6a23 isoform X2 [Lycorma delicatula]